MAVTAVAVAAAVVASSSAETRTTAGERPRGAVENCPTSRGWPGGSVREFTNRSNLIVGPVAVHGAGVKLYYNENVGGNKLLVHVKAGHRVTLELPRQTRNDMGFAFGTPPGATSGSKWNLRNTRRVVTFRACQRGESADLHYEEWPVSGWVGFLLARSPMCVPLSVWIDNEPTPRKTIIRFGVTDCA